MMEYHKIYLDESCWFIVISLISVSTGEEEGDDDDDEGSSHITINKGKISLEVERWDRPPAFFPDIVVVVVVVVVIVVVEEEEEWFGLVVGWEITRFDRFDRFDEDDDEVVVVVVVVVVEVEGFIRRRLVCELTWRSTAGSVNFSEKMAKELALRW